MAGGLLNIVFTGNNNIFLTEIHQKHSLKLHMLNIRILAYKNSELIITV